MIVRLLPLAMLLNSYEDYIGRNLKNTSNKVQKLKLLESVLKDIAYLTMKAIPLAKLSSMKYE